MLHAKAYSVTWVTAAASWKNTAHRVTHREHISPPGLKDPGVLQLQLRTLLSTHTEQHQLLTSCFSPPTPHSNQMRGVCVGETIGPEVVLPVAVGPVDLEFKEELVQCGARG